MDEAAGRVTDRLACKVSRVFLLVYILTKIQQSKILKQVKCYHKFNCTTVWINLANIIQFHHTEPKNMVNFYFLE